MRRILLSAFGMFMMGLALRAEAQLTLSELREDFEDDALGSLPSAYGPTYWGNDSLVVASGEDGIASPDGSAQYAKFIGPRLGSSFWFNDAAGYPCVLPLGHGISADFYIAPNDPAAPANQNVYLASTFWVDQVYNGEIGLGYTLLNDGSGDVVFHVTRFQGSLKNPQPVAVSAGWYHLEMLWDDTDRDCKVDVTCTVLDPDGNVAYAWIEQTGIAVDETYRTAGFQIQAGRTEFVPLRVDNLAAFGIDVDVKANGSDTPLTVGIGEPVSVTIEMQPDDRFAGLKADWWILASAPNGGWYHFDVGIWGWKSRPELSGTWTLEDLPQTLVLDNFTGLQAGTYVFYFIIDAKNGYIDRPLRYFDSVEVTVTE